MNLGTKHYRTFTRNTKEKTVESFNTRLSQLDEKIDNVVQQLEYYDLIKLANVINSESEFLQKLSQTLPYQSVIINCDSFNYNGKDYSRGDIVLKFPDKTVHIPSNAAGFYYPSEIQKTGNTYKLVYTYSTEVPLKTDPVDFNVDTPVNKPYSSIGFNGISVQGQNATYGQEVNILDGKPTSIEIEGKKIKGTENYIRPIIKFFHDNEEVFCEYKLTSPTTTQEPKTTKYIISDYPSIVTKIVVK